MSLQRTIRRPSHRQIPSPNSGKVLAKSWRSPGENHSKHSEQPKRMNSKRRCGGFASAYSIRRTRCLQRERSVQNTLPNVVLLGSLPPLTPPPASASPPYPSHLRNPFCDVQKLFLLLAPKVASLAALGLCSAASTPLLGVLGSFFY